MPPSAYVSMQSFRRGLILQVVSVIVPIFNALPYLEQALESLRLQTHAALQVICVNDGSTDASLDVIRKFVESDSRFELLDQVNQGYGAACNNGLSHAYGEWVAVLEPDDWIEADAFESALAFAAKNAPTAQLVKTPYWRVIAANTPHERKIPCNFKGRKVLPQPFAVEDQPWLLEEHPSIWSALYRRSFLEEEGISFPEFPGAGWADNYFLIETLCRAKRIAYSDKAFYCYREDSFERFERFIKGNRLLPFERWQGMTDILEHLGVYDAGVLAAHYKRGFAYMNDVVSIVGEDDPEVAQASESMMKRMNAYVIFGDPSIAPSYKKAFAKAVGCELSGVNEVGYQMYRCGTMLRKLNALGPSNAFALLRHRMAGR